MVQNTKINIPDGYRQLSTGDELKLGDRSYSIWLDTWCEIMNQRFVDQHKVVKLGQIIIRKLEN